MRPQNTFKRPLVNSVYNGTETVSFLGPKIWELTPTEIKELVSLNGFKKAIKEWKPVNCPCRLCKTYIHQHQHDVSYLNILNILTEIKIVSKFNFPCINPF